MLPRIDPSSSRPSTCNVLLVEADAALAKVIARELQRTHSVSIAASIKDALTTIQSGATIHVVVANDRIGAGTATELFTALKVRYPAVRRILYAEAIRQKVGARQLAHAIVDAASSFKRLSETIATTLPPSLVGAPLPFDRSSHNR